MDPATVYRNVRRSLTDFDERVVARYLDAEAPVRTSFRQLLRSLDDIAGRLLGDDQLSRPEDQKGQTGHPLELAGSQTRLEAGAHLGIGGFTHAATQRIAEDVTFIGDSLALEAALASEGDGLLSDPLHRFGNVLRDLPLTARPRLGDDFIGLVAELCGKLAMRGQHLGGRLNQLFVTGGMRGDLGGFMAVEAALFHA